MSTPYEYAEAPNDIADLLDLPTGSTSAQIVAAARERCAGRLCRIKLPLPTCSAVARPIADRAKEYHAWRDRLAADPACWKFSEREDAIAFAAYIAGWWMRTGDNPDDFFNPPNVRPLAPADTQTPNEDGHS